MAGREDPRTGFRCVSLCLLIFCDLVACFVWGQVIAGWLCLVDFLCFVVECGCVEGYGCLVVVGCCLLYEVEGVL